MKEFFTKKPVMIAEAVLLALSAAGLTVSGLSAEGITGISMLSIAAVGAIDAVITAITAIVSKK